MLWYRAVAVEGGKVIRLIGGGSGGELMEWLLKSELWSLFSATHRSKKPKISELHTPLTLLWCCCLCCCCCCCCCSFFFYLVCGVCVFFFFVCGVCVF